MKTCPICNQQLKYLDFKYSQCISKIKICLQENNIEYLDFCMDIDYTLCVVQVTKITNDMSKLFIGTSNNYGIREYCFNINPINYSSLADSSFIEECKSTILKIIESHTLE
jgi:hypothetical protein